MAPGGRKTSVVHAARKKCNKAYVFASKVTFDTDLDKKPFDCTAVVLSIYTYYESASAFT